MLKGARCLNCVVGHENRGAVDAGRETTTQGVGAARQERGCAGVMTGACVCRSIRASVVLRSRHESVRVFVANDHAILRGALCAVIDMQQDMEVVGEAATGPDAEIGIKETADPDVVLMEIGLSERRGARRYCRGERDSSHDADCRPHVPRGARIHPSGRAAARRWMRCEKSAEVPSSARDSSGRSWPPPTASARGPLTKGRPRGAGRRGGR